MDTILYTTKMGLLLWLVANRNNITMYFIEWWERNQNKTLNELAIDAFWKGSYIYTFVKYRCGKLHSTFPLVRSFVSAFDTAKPSVEYPWASITQLIEDETGKLCIVEEKFDLTAVDWLGNSISDNFLQLHQLSRDILKKNTQVMECLLLVAENETGVYSRVIHRKNVDMEMDTRISTNLVPMKFLLLDYVYPDHEDSYELVLDKRYFMEGNQILSGAFVGRLLANQGYSGAFDTSYRVVIIDHDVKTVEWTYADFMEVGSDKNYAVRLYEEPEPTMEEPKQLEENDHMSVEDEETKSWDKVDKE